MRLIRSNGSLFPESCLKEPTESNQAENQTPINVYINQVTFNIFSNGLKESVLADGSQSKMQEQIAPSYLEVDENLDEKIWITRVKNLNYYPRLEIRQSNRLVDLPVEGEENAFLLASSLSKVCPLRLRILNIQEIWLHTKETKLFLNVKLQIAQLEKDWEDSEAYFDRKRESARTSFSVEIDKTIREVNQKVSVFAPYNKFGNIYMKRQNFSNFRVRLELTITKQDEVLLSLFSHAFHLASSWEVADKRKCN